MTWIKTRKKCRERDKDDDDDDEWSLPFGTIEIVCIFGLIKCSNILEQTSDEYTGTGMARGTVDDGKILLMQVIPTDQRRANWRLMTMVACTSVCMYDYVYVCLHVSFLPTFDGFAQTKYWLQSRCFRVGINATKSSINYLILK